MQSSGVGGAPFGSVLDALGLNEFNAPECKSSPVREASTPRSPIPAMGIHRKGGYYCNDIDEPGYTSPPEKAEIHPHSSFRVTVQVPQVPDTLRRHSRVLKPHPGSLLSLLLRLVREHLLSELYIPRSLLLVVPQERSRKPSSRTRHQGEFILFRIPQSASNLFGYKECMLTVLRSLKAPLLITQLSMFFQREIVHDRV